MTAKMKCFRCQKNITMSGSRVCPICRPDPLVDYERKPEDYLCDDCFPLIHNEERC